MQYTQGQVVLNSRWYHPGPHWKIRGGISWVALPADEVWIPKSAGDIERAAQEPLGVPETTSCDCKRELPAPHKNRDVAEDVAAMANEGGVLIYCIGEDQQRRATVLCPFILAGAKEKVDQIIQTGVAEPPYFILHLHPLDADPDRGYMVIEVPMSPRAPHMVIHSGDHRYYRRTPTGNMVMNQAEVEAMFQRRQDWGRRAADELEGSLRRPVGLLPSAVSADRDLATLRLVARPVALGRQLLSGYARPDSTDRPLLVQAVQETRAANVPSEVGQFSDGVARSALAEFVDVSSWKRLTSGWVASFEAFRNDGIWTDARGSHELLVQDDGLVQLHCGRIGEVAGGQLAQGAPSRMVLFVDWMGEAVIRFSAFAGALYRSTDFNGPVDVGLLVSNTVAAIASRGWPAQQPVREKESRCPEAAGRSGPAARGRPPFRAADGRAEKVQGAARARTRGGAPPDPPRSPRWPGSGAHGHSHAGRRRSQPAALRSRGGGRVACRASLGADGCHL